MVQLSDRVQPGEVITSELMNFVLANLETLYANIAGLSGGAGTVVVPSVFARTLADARIIIALPLYNLKLGNVIDAFGQAVSVNTAGSAARLVIGQVPAYGTRVAPGTAVNLVLAAIPSSGPGTGSTLPTIEQSVTQLKTHIGDQIIITGSNFAALRTDNQVLFDNVPAAAPSSSSGTTALFVVVPDISSPPTGSQEKTVSLKVTTPAGSITSSTILLSKLSVANPVISSIDPSPNDTGVQGEILTINGTGFATPASNNRIFFDSAEAAPESLGNSATKLVVRVPTFDMGGLHLKSVQVMIMFRGDNPPTSPTFPLTVSKP